MSRVRIALLSITILALAALLFAPATSQSQTPQASPTPKPGGVLNMMLREDLSQGFSIHETATISTVWPAIPCFSNLVLFDPTKPTQNPDTVVSELAQHWSWQND